MIDNGEKFAIVKSPCYIHNKKTVFKNTMTRAEAVERIAKGLCRIDNLWETCAGCRYYKKKNLCKAIIIAANYLTRAEAALDALLGKEAENDK